VTREFQTLEGTVTAGQHARLDKHAFPGDPLRAFGLPFREVKFESPLGPMPAWYVPEESDRWVIFVHGVNGKRTEGLRILWPLSDSGDHVLLISLRNDEGVPGDPSGRHQYGRTEWQDLEAAAHFALSSGAKDLVIAGSSMGGGVAMSFMRNSLLASEVSGLILDSPMLDFSATVDDAGKRRNLPGFLTATAKWIAGWRYGVAWDELDYLKDADRLKAPVLLFHGTADDKVPLATSEALAVRRGDIVQFEVFQDAQHAASWNLDPARYEAAVRTFLSGAAAR
jgi:alpha-beta hydrolase superfamily lysophospholipase